MRKSKKKDLLDEEVFTTAIEKYGIEAQIGMAQEEMGELLVAINHLRRKRIPWKNFIEEVADVYIMMRQLRHMDEKLFDKIYHRKVKKIRKKLEIKD
jgi:NTP pyrophosphatase (non-canonical NTP hydrolase)